jgi:hypothetical protein
MLVRMRIGISGHRNGERWPPVDATLDVPDAEGADLIRAELAAPYGKDAEALWDMLRDDFEGPRPGHPSKLDGRPASQVEGERLAAEALAADAVPGDVPEPPGYLDAGDDGAEAGAGDDGAEAGAGDDDQVQEPGEPDAVTPAPVAPGPAAPKAAWIDWAVSQGADQDKAAAMTKADLMSRYGGRL